MMMMKKYDFDDNNDIENGHQHDDENEDQEG